MGSENRMRLEQEVDWERLDKTRFFVGGAALFSGVTTALYPLSVIKTRQMVIPGMSPGLSGVRQTFVHVLHQDGVRGLYRGFGTTIVGSVPVRGVYLTVLEAVKSGGQKTLSKLQLGEAQSAAASNFVAGACASFCSQGVTVPLDVVSQRLQVHSRGANGAPIYNNGLQAARMIVATEGVSGLYRGLGASLATYMPASAIWWSAYGGYKSIVWQTTHDWFPEKTSSSTRTVVVQTVSSICAGFTSGILTNPLDVVKTRIQVIHTARDDAIPTFMGTLRQLLKEDGPTGLMRGVVPKMANTALWSTCMVSVYEFLKRLAQKPDGLEVG